MLALLFFTRTYDIWRPISLSYTENLVLLFILSCLCACMSATQSSGWDFILVQRTFSSNNCMQCIPRDCLDRIRFEIRNKKNCKCITCIIRYFSIENVEAIMLQSYVSERKGLIKFHKCKNIKFYILFRKNSSFLREIYSSRKFELWHFLKIYDRISNVKSFPRENKSPKSITDFIYL